MAELAGLSIRIESPFSDDVRALIASSEAESGAGTVPALQELRVPNAECLVARLDGRPVGCVVLIDQLDYGEVRRLYVTSEARGMRIAVALVQALEDAARDLGLRRVRIADEGQVRAATRTFSRLGFRPAGERHEAWMEKSL